MNGYILISVAPADGSPAFICYQKVVAGEVVGHVDVNASPIEMPTVYESQVGTGELLETLNGIGV